MSTISITIKATVPLPPGPSKAAQLAMAAMQAANKAGAAIREAVGGDITVMTQAEDGRLARGKGNGIVVTSPMEASERAPRRGRRGRRKASDTKEGDSRPTIIVDPAERIAAQREPEPPAEPQAEPEPPPPAARQEEHARVTAPSTFNGPRMVDESDLLEIPGFLRK